MPTVIHIDGPSGSIEHFSIERGESVSDALKRSGIVWKNKYLTVKEMPPLKLMPEAAQIIGTRCEWEAAYVIEEGPYEGQMACTPILGSAPFAWTPACDLADIEHRQYAQSMR